METSSENWSEETKKHYYIEVKEIIQQQEIMFVF